MTSPWRWFAATLTEAWPDWTTVKVWRGVAGLDHGEGLARVAAGVAAAGC